LRHCTTSWKMQVQFLMVAMEIFIDIIVLAALWFWG
jgi:hypothetical protein